jgi:hypothetical protein
LIPIAFLPSGSPSTVPQPFSVNKPLLSKSGPLPVAVFFFASALGLTGCGENIFEQRWTRPTVETVLIYSLGRPEINLPSGFDFVNRFTVGIHESGATGTWDLVLDTQDGQLVFLPPGALGITTTTLLLPLPGMAFDDVLRAPKDTTLYTRDQPVPVDPGTVYVLRTHKASDRFGGSCLRYGKFQPLAVRLNDETVEFTYDVNTRCDDRALIPEE